MLASVANHNSFRTGIEYFMLGKQECSGCIECLWSE
jgi:hypothetical protein